jgi:carboxymethylenebutenolidase
MAGEITPDSRATSPGIRTFLRDEGPRYDPALAYHCYGLVFELFHRRLGSGGLAD